MKNRTCIQSAFSAEEYQSGPIDLQALQNRFKKMRLQAMQMRHPDRIAEKQE